MLHRNFTNYIALKEPLESPSGRIFHKYSTIVLEDQAPFCTGRVLGSETMLGIVLFGATSSKLYSTHREITHLNQKEIFSILIET
jgi:hypothetical protein